MAKNDSKSVNFIAVYDEYYGIGSTPDEAVTALQTAVEQQDTWDSDNMSDVRIYEVGRVGKATITVVWEEESK